MEFYSGMQQHLDVVISFHCEVAFINEQISGFLLILFSHFQLLLQCHFCVLKGVFILTQLSLKKKKNKKMLLVYS